jgi:hypothetical protein
MEDYESKYLKYKLKYLELKKSLNGGVDYITRLEEKDRELWLRPNRPNIHKPISTPIPTPKPINNCHNLHKYLGGEEINTMCHFDPQKRDKTNNEENYQNAMSIISNAKEQGTEFKKQNKIKESEQCLLDSAIAYNNCNSLYNITKTRREELNRLIEEKIKQIELNKGHLDDYEREGVIVEVENNFRPKTDYQKIIDNIIKNNKSQLPKL